MHIAEQIADVLEADGWTLTKLEGTVGFTAQKKIVGYAEAGTVSDGTRNVTLDCDETGRWFSRVDGWGNVQKDVDLRNFANEPKKAVDTVLGKV